MLKFNNKELKKSKQLNDWAVIKTKILIKNRLKPTDELFQDRVSLEKK